MTDHVPGPNTPASSPSLTELHRLAREDYAAGQQQRALSAAPAPSTSYTPLHGPDDGTPFPGTTLASELEAAQEYLAKVAATNIHDPYEMVKAAAGLDYRLRALVAAIAAERGEAK